MLARIAATCRVALELRGEKKPQLDHEVVPGKGFSRKPTDTGHTGLGMCAHRPKLC